MPGTGKIDRRGVQQLPCTQQGIEITSP